MIAYIIGIIKEFSSINFTKQIVNFISGFIFGSGLLISGLCNNQRVINFLSFSSNADMTIGIAFVTAVIINFLANRIILVKGPRHGPFEAFNPKAHTWLLVGCLLFGLGWGISGIRPGPAMILIVAQPNSVYFFLSMVLGMVIYEKNLFKMKKHNMLEDNYL